MSKKFSPSPSFSISSERLHISYLISGNPDHAAFFLRLWSCEEVTKFIRKRGIDSLESANIFIRTQVQDEYNQNGYGRHLVSLKPHPDASLAESTPIGMVSLLSRDLQNGCRYSCPDIGFAFVPDYWGKGYAAEAAKGLIDYARGELGVEGIFGFCNMENVASRRTLEKIGLEFRGEKVLKAFDGQRSAVYALPDMDSDLHVYGIDDSTA